MPTSKFATLLVTLPKASVTIALYAALSFVETGFKTSILESEPGTLLAVNQFRAIFCPLISQHCCRICRDRKRCIAAGNNGFANWLLCYCRRNKHT